MFYIAPIEKAELVIQSEQSKDLRRYDYCGKLKHTRETCTESQLKVIRERMVDLRELKKI